MNDQKLDQLIENLKNHPVPEPPANLESCVLREIRSIPSRKGRDLEWPGFSWILGARLAAITGLLALGSGLIVGSVVAQSAFSDDKESTRRALGLEIFVTDSVECPIQSLRE